MLKKFFQQRENAVADFVDGAGGVDFVVHIACAIIGNERLGLGVVGVDAVADDLVGGVVGAAFDLGAVADALIDHRVRNHDGDDAGEGFTTGDVNPGDNALALIPSILYAVYYVVNMVLNGVGEWPDTNDWYGFLNWGIPGAIGIAAGIFAVTYVIGLILRKAARG